ncbi:hypothetical protein ACQB60_28785 [Actinomycetota bacterium Odt1-20B]
MTDRTGSENPDGLRPRLRVHDAFGDTWDDPSEKELQRLFAGLNLNRPFLVLEHPDRPNADQHYLQIALNEDLTMVLEFRDGGPDAHYRAEVPLPAEQGGDGLVTPVLLGYAACRPGWRGDALAWQRWDVEQERPRDT